MEEENENLILGTGRCVHLKPVEDDEILYKGTYFLYFILSLLFTLQQ